MPSLNKHGKELLLNKKMKIENKKINSENGANSHLHFEILITNDIDVKKNREHRPK